jgi:hypothetical protein
MIYLDNAFGTVHWDDSLSAVCVTFKAFVDGEDFRSLSNAGIELLIQKKASKWLGDCRNMGAVTQEDQRWSSEDWLPRVMAAGLTHMAIVSPKKVVAQMAVKTFMTKVQGKQHVTMNFDDLEKARAWLRAQKPR